ncbi:MAG: mechanosensitive ion channel family protein [Phycisphaerae bacterium]
MISLGQVLISMVTAWVLVAGAAAGLLLNALLFALAGLLTRRRHGLVTSLMVRYYRAPGFALLGLLGVLLVLPIARVSPSLTVVVRRTVAIAFIAAFYWLVVRTTRVFREAVQQKYDLDVDDYVRARRMHTQISLLNRVVLAVLGFVALGGMLMVFPRIRQVGASLLASAGIIGIVLGIAAQRTLANLVAGLMIAFTQPIRLDDVVIVEDEWGRIEEITLTYVVVRIWDLRRLVVPVTYFVERPFQNWSRISPDLLGKAFLYLDFNAPIPAIREQLGRICHDSELWDGKLWGLQVVEATETAIQVRALASAPTSGIAWDLRCEIREKLVAWIRENCPEALPRTRLVGGRHGDADGPVAHLATPPGERPPRTDEEPGS